MITALTLAASLVALPTQEIDSARFLAAVREVEGTAGTAHLKRAGMPVTAYALGACWRLGLEGGKKALKRGDQIPYADSVHNLYYEKKN